MDESKREAERKNLQLKLGDQMREIGDAIFRLRAIGEDIEEVGHRSYGVSATVRGHEVLIDQKEALSALRRELKDSSDELLKKIGKVPELRVKRSD